MHKQLIINFIGILIGLASTGAHAAPITVSAGNIEDFLYLGGGLRLACYAPQASPGRLSMRALKPGAVFRSVNSTRLLRRYSRNLKLLLQRSKGAGSSAVLKHQASKLKRCISELKQAKKSCKQFHNPRRSSGSSMSAGSSSSPGTTSSSSASSFGLCGGEITAPSDPSSTLTPIARWDTVPYQRIDAGQTLNLGVVAFSKAGIERVEFHITGAGYVGGIKAACEPSLNPQTNVWEYWTPLSANEFSGDGLVTVEPIVIGKDGGIRNKDSTGGKVGLDAMTLTANPLGGMPQFETWVEVSGNDQTGRIGDETKPYATIGRAIDGIRAERNSRGLGNNADGGIVRLKPGEHSMSRGGIWDETPVSNEWVTITAAAGGDKSNTSLQHGNGGTPKVKLLKVQGITLQSHGQYDFAVYSGAEGAQVWIDKCDLIGAGRYIDGGYLVVNPTYYTDSYITAAYPVAAANAIMARGLNIENIGCDAFANTPCVLTTRVDDIDSGSTGCHADAFQLFWVGQGGPKGNVIIYNYQVHNAFSQSIFVADKPAYPFVLDGAAIVNTYIDSSMFGQWGVDTNHFVFWHNSINALSDGWGYIFRDGISNFSVIGNMFGSLLVNDSILTEAHDNHFVIGTLHGHNATSGDPQMDAQGKPIASSPLCGRVAPPVVGVDVDNQVRTSPADVGAYVCGN